MHNLVDLPLYFRTPPRPSKELSAKLEAKSGTTRGKAACKLPENPAAKTFGEIAGIRRSTWKGSTRIHVNRASAFQKSKSESPRFR